MCPRRQKCPRRVPPPRRPPSPLTPPSASKDKTTANSVRQDYDEFVITLIGAELSWSQSDVSVITDSFVSFIPQR